MPSSGRQVALEALGWAAWYFLFCIGGDRLVRATVRT